jgi:hypothetical protein
VLWNSFNDRLGQFEHDKILFDLNGIIHSTEMPELDEPFSNQEIDALIKDLPIDKAPGPDGFNGMFIKKCWSIIKSDFMPCMRLSLMATWISEVSTVPILL